MKRSVTVAAAATAIVVVGLSGCSSNKSSTSSPGHRRAQSTAAATGSSGSPTAKVTIDGKDQNVQGRSPAPRRPATSTSPIGGASTGIGAVLTDANPPAVKSVGLGNVNGVTLGYTPGTGQGNASATKDGSKLQDHRDRDRGGHGQPDAAGEQVLRDRRDLPLGLRRSVEVVTPTRQRRPGVAVVRWVSSCVQAFIPVVERQPDREVGVARRAVQRDRAVVGFDHRRDDRQAQPGAAALAGSGGVAAGEPLEHLRLQLLGDPRPVVDARSARHASSSEANRVVTTVPGRCGRGRWPAGWSPPDAAGPRRRQTITGSSGRSSSHW